MKRHIIRLIASATLAVAFLLPIGACGNAHSYWGVENEYGYAGGSYGPDFGYYKRNPDHKHHKHHKHHKPPKPPKHKKHKRNPDRHKKHGPGHFKRNPDHHHHHHDD